MTLCPCDCWKSLCLRVLPQGEWWTWNPCWQSTIGPADGGADGVPEEAKIASLELGGQVRALGFSEGRLRAQDASLPPSQGWRSSASLPPIFGESAVGPEREEPGKGSRHLHSV